MKKVAIDLPQRGWGSIKTKYPSHSIFVGIDELTGASKNFDSTFKGSLTKRKGGTNYEQSADADGPNKDQFEAIFTDGTHHLLKAVAGKLKYSSGGGTFTTVTTGYSTLGNFEFGVYSDRVYFGNGIDSPQVYDRTTSYGGVGYSAPQTKVMGAQAPGTAPTFAADTAGGSVPAGAHTYKVTFLYYDLEESNGGPASAVHTVAGPNFTVNLTAIPVGGYGVTARKIYRDNNDGAWLLVGTIANNTATTFTDTAAVGTALIPLDHNVPPSFKYIKVHLDRTWIAGVPGDPSTLYFSEAGLPNVFPSANVIICNPEDPITAIFVYNDRIIVLNRNSLGQILGTTSDTFRYSAIPSSVGCVDNRSVQIRTKDSVPTLVWLSDKGVYGTNGTAVEYLSDAIEDLVNLNIQQASQVRGQNAQTSQSQFQGGTPSPGIDLTTSPGFITTPNPRRVWDDEGDWEGGSSLSNIATNDGSNQLKVPTRHAPAFSSGTHSNTQEVSGTLRLPLSTDFTGRDQTGYSNCRYSNAGNTPAEFAQQFTVPRSGTLTSATVRYHAHGNGPGVARIRIYADASGLPGSVIYDGPDHNVTNHLSEESLTDGGLSVSLSAGTNYWIGCRHSISISGGDGTSNTNPGPQFTTDINAGTCRVNYTGSWTAFFAGGVTVTPTALKMAFTFTASAIASSGIWTGPIYDSYSDSAVAALIAHTGSFPGGTSSTTTVEASNDSGMAGAVSQNFSSLNGSTAVSLSGYRYWRIKIQLSTADNRTTPQVGSPTLTYSLTGVWISEVLDHTTDITLLNALTSVTSVPGGTTVTVEIATSANNITYSAYTSVGSATPQLYSKVRITLTTTSDNATTPSVTSTELDWTVVANLVSSGIDTGATPAGWDIFQAQYADNGGTVQFYMRSATTLGGLTSETFVAVTNGQFPSIPVRRFVQWKVVLTSTAGHVPAVDSVTVNWFISQVSSIRVASIFYNRSYYLAAAEYNNATNNLLIVWDGEDKWRVHRGISINTLSFFFNEPYYGSAVEGRIIKFQSGDTDQGTPIEMIVETKAMDFGDLPHTKVLRKVYLHGKNTGAVFTVSALFDNNGVQTIVDLVDPLTGLTTFTTASDGSDFFRRFVPNFSLGQQTAGKHITIRITESTAAPAQIDELRLEAWMREGELVA